MSLEEKDHPATQQHVAPQYSSVCVERIERNSCVPLAHPPYILDVAYSNQHVFGFVNDHMRGRQYVTSDTDQGVACHCV